MLDLHAALASGHPAGGKEMLQRASAGKLVHGEFLTSRPLSADSRVVLAVRKEWNLRSLPQFRKLTKPNFTATGYIAPHSS